MPELTLSPPPDSLPFVRFLRLNGSPVMMTPISITYSAVTKLTISVNPSANVRLAVYDANTGDLVYHPAATTTPQHVHVLTIPANTLSASTPYILRVDQEITNSTNTCEIQAQTNP